MAEDGTLTPALRQFLWLRHPYLPTRIARKLTVFPEECLKN